MTLLEPEQESIESRPTENMEAYQAYLRGIELWNRPGYDAPRFSLARELLERAVELAPEDPLNRLYLADALPRSPLGVSEWTITDPIDRSDEPIDEAGLLFFTLLFSLIITLFDRYRPAGKAVAPGVAVSVGAGLGVLLG